MVTDQAAITQSIAQAAVETAKAAVQAMAQGLEVSQHALDPN